jgi:hypothetical protein
MSPFLIALEVTQLVYEKPVLYSSYITWRGECERQKCGEEAVGDLYSKPTKDQDRSREL